MTQQPAVSDGGTEKFEFRCRVTGGYCEAEASSESAAREMAAQSIGADPSDLRRIYDHSGRKPEDTEAVEEVMREALGDDYDVE